MLAKCFGFEGSTPQLHLCHGAFLFFIFSVSWRAKPTFIFWEFKLNYNVSYCVTSRSVTGFPFLSRTSWRPRVFAADFLPRVFKINQEHEPLNLLCFSLKHKMFNIKMHHSPSLFSLVVNYRSSASNVFHICSFVTRFALCRSSKLAKNLEYCNVYSTYKILMKTRHQAHHVGTGVIKRRENTTSNACCHKYDAAVMLSVTVSMWRHFSHSWTLSFWPEISSKVDISS